MLGVGSLPSTDNLIAFLAASEHRNFRRAARQVALTPAAFGQRIKQLEDQLGSRLFDRTTRSVELTAAGQRLIPIAQQVVGELVTCRERVTGDDLTPVRITLATRFELGLSWIVPALVSLRQTHPQLNVDLYFGSGPDILRRLDEGLVDCAITSAPRAHRDWKGELLHPEHYVLVGAPALLAEVPFDTPADAEAHVLLDVDATLPLARYLTSAVGSIEFGEVRLCGAGGAMCDLAVAGFGVAVLPEYLARRGLEDGTLVRLLPEVVLLSDSFRLVYRASSVHEPWLLRLASFLRSKELT